MSSLLIIVPALNEGKFIGTVVRDIKALGHDVLVIDDGSTDDTAQLAKASGAQVISTGRRSGKGNALRVGFDAAIKANVEVVITLDGDGQHAISDVKTFVDKYAATKAGLINGNRLENPKGMPWLRLLTNKFMSWIISSICRQRVADSQCGFRLMTTEMLRAVKLESDNYEIETELLVQASKKGFRIDNVPVRTIYRDEVSKIRPLNDTWRFIKYLIKESRRK